MDREAALAALRRRVENVTDPQSAAGLLSDQARREAAALVDAGGSDEDLSVARVLGMFHWYRYLVLPEGDDQEELNTAVEFLYPVYHVHPDAVPEPLRVTFARAGRKPGSRTATAASANQAAGVLFRTYQQTGHLAPLDEAVALLRDAVANTPHDDPAYPSCLSNLGLALRAMSEHTSDAALLMEAVEVGRRAVAATSNDRLDHARCLSMLGLALRALFERTGDTTVLVEAVEVGRQAVATASPDHSDRDSCSSNLGLALRALFAQTGNTAVLAEAVDVSRQAVAGARGDNPHRVGHLVNLGFVLRELFEQTGDAPLLAEVVQVCREAVAATSGGHPQHVGVLANLSGALQALSEQSVDAGLLAEAVEVGRQAVAGMSDGHPHRARFLSNLSLALRALYERTGDIPPLAEAVEAGRQAVAGTPDDHPDRASYQSNLSLALRALFERTGNTTPLAEAVEVCRQAVAGTPDDHPDHASYLDSLSLALRALAEESVDADLLAEAVQVSRRAVRATADNDPRHARHLNHLGIALKELAKRTGKVGPLAEAVEVSGRAVAITRDSHPHHAAFLSNLSLALQALSERTGDTTPLAEAVEVSRRAVRATADNDPRHAGHLSYLGLALWVLARRTGNTDLLVEALEVSCRAVTITPTGHPDQAGYLNNLSVVLRELPVDPLPPDAAVEVSRQAVADTPNSHPYYARRVNNLGAMLQELAERTGDLSLFAEAVEVCRRAVAGTPDNHPEHARFMQNLGFALQGLAERTEDTALSAEALESFRTAAHNHAATAFDRVQALRQVALLAGAAPSGIEEALAAVEEAVVLLPQISRRTLARDDQRHQVRRLGSLAEVAAEAALEAGSPQRAVELLEATRGMLAAGTIDARGNDLTRLREHDEGLARDFESLRDRLEALDSPETGHAAAIHTESYRAGEAQGPVRAARSVALARRLAQVEWDRLVAQIRAEDGFSGFLDTPPLAELSEQSGQGPIVFLNAGPNRCDALLLGGVTPGEVRTVRLSRLTAHDAHTRVEQLARARDTATDTHQPPMARKAAQGEILDILAWLWDTVAEPVLNAIGLTGKPAEGGPFPRIWWCPVGVMCYLPVHAAGHHRDLKATDPLRSSNPRTVLDRVISSYIPTVRALKYARSHRPPAADGTLIISVPDAPGARPLSGDEADTVNTLIPEALRPDRPVRADVLAALPTHPVAHFSCHGLAVVEDPAASRLILHDHEASPLTVADISALQLTGSLAFLSACDTSSTSPQLADEAVHLTGAFHLAGYQNVIGTLWPVNAAAAACIAADFYAHLTADGTTPPDTANSARALHHAVHTLRARYLLSPTHWAAHTHTGL
ncbi:CHAT domain-containing protein [Streptomyces kebangsaanensis]|uniref:CHAT domain-containing protein n=1 Tax=Streptomyces kebangsaanensis TaxID=864058 RepID=A0ABW6L147_9ACTN